MNLKSLRTNCIRLTSLGKACTWFKATLLAPVAFFRKPSAQEKQLYLELYAEIARLRLLCQSRIESIERLHGQAEQLLTQINSLPASIVPVAAQAVDAPLHLRVKRLVKRGIRGLLRFNPSGRKRNVA